MDVIRQIMSSVEKGILTNREGARLVYNWLLTKMESATQIEDVLKLCSEEIRDSIKQILADIPVLECDWSVRRTLTSNGLLPVEPPETRARIIALKEHCVRNGIELPPTSYPELAELTLTPSEILEIDNRPWSQKCLYDYVEKYAFRGSLVLSPQVPSHGAVPKRHYSLDEMEGNPYLGRLWVQLLNFHPWERTAATGSRTPAAIMLLNTERDFIPQTRLAVIRGGDSLAVLDALVEESNASRHDGYSKWVCDRFEAGASFVLYETPAAAVARALLLAKLSRQRLLAEINLA